MRDLETEYKNWLIHYVTDSYRERSELSRMDILNFLYNTEFEWTIDNDKNRANDGVDMRYHFALNRGYDVDDVFDILNQPCNMLEMMIALAIRIEENIMDDAEIGNRTSQWFWSMVNNLGLGGMYGRHFDQREADECMERFMTRTYSPDGRGGLFRVRHPQYDLRRAEIWYQMNWYLREIIPED